MPPGLDRYIKVRFSDASGIALEVDQTFDISFNVDKSRYRDPDTCEVTVYNLKKNIRAFIGASAETVEIFASRTRPPALIFKGEIIDANSIRSDDFVDWMSIISAEDTKSKMRTRIVSRTFAAGTLLRTAFLDLAAAAEMQSVLIFEDLALPEPISFLAPPKDCLQDLASRYGLRYQIIDGRLHVTGENTELVGTVVPLISAQTGLIGVPSVKREKKKTKIDFSCMLEPSLIPGGLVNLQTSSIESGRTAQLNSTIPYWINRVNHSGETKGNFSSSVECQER